MGESTRYVVGTSGYSFADWVGPFYPPGIGSSGMFDYYARHFRTVELNFTYYRMSAARTLEKLARSSPEAFTFWVKANQETTHKQNRSVAGEFIENLAPLTTSGKLAGILLQFPQSFHRTNENRKYLSAALGDFASLPTAVEFRHRSWDHPCTISSLRQRNVTLVVPDVPALRDLYSVPPIATTRTAYLRLHSRRGDTWYAGGPDRYDYKYTSEELSGIIADWSQVARGVDRIYTFFNNCHGGQAAENARTFRRMVEHL